MNKKIKWLIALVIVGGLVAGIIALRNLYIQDTQTDSLTKWYYLGGICSGVFAMAAFAGVLYTNYSQKKQSIKQLASAEASTKSQEKYYKEQLEQTKKNTENQQNFYKSELQNAQATIELQKTAIDAQNKTQARQSFDNTFFHMQKMLLGIVDSLFLEIPYSKGKGSFADGKFEGRTVFEVMYNSASLKVEHNEEIESLLTEARATHNYGGKQYYTGMVGMKDVIETFGLDGYHYTHELPIFDHYFRYLYTIIKYIDKSPELETFEERYKYTSMIRGNLSRYELVWLYYNGLSEYGFDKFKPLMEKYALLKNIRDELLAQSYEYKTELQNGGGNQLSNGYPTNDYEFFLSETDDLTKIAYTIKAFKNAKESPGWELYYNAVRTNANRYEAYSQYVDKETAEEN